MPHRSRLRRPRGLASLPVPHPWLTVLLWLALAALATLAARTVHPPASSTSFLPADVESQRAAALEARFTGGRQTVEVVIVDARGLGAADQRLAGQLADWLRSRPRSADVLSVGPPLASLDGKALVVQVTFRSTGPPPDGPDPRVASIERHLAQTKSPKAVQVGLAGEPAVSNDVNAGIVGGGSSGSSDALRALGVLVIAVVLGLVYRAPLAVLVPLASIGLVLATSSSLAGLAAATVGLPMNSFSVPFVYAVVLGAGTNYGLLLISRYREELRRGGERREALEAASRRVAPAIASSAATVALGTAVMAFTSLGFFRTLGPAVALSIVVMLVAGLTLTPALIEITGRAFFWPRQPRPATSLGTTTSRIWNRIGWLVTRRPGLVLVTALAVLVLPILGLKGLQVSVDLQGELPAGSPSLTGYRLLQAHLPAWSQATPVFVTADGSAAQLEGAKLAQVGEAMRSVPGVLAVGGPAIAPDGSAGMFQVALGDDPSGERASATLTAAEAAARRSLAVNHVGHAQVLAGGEVAADRDLRQLLAQDFLRVVVLVAAAIYAVLAVLLRNLFAPLYLLASVGLSTAAAVGAVGFLYRTLAGQPLYWAVPVFAFVFLVALGEDFNIYLVSRLRQELSVGDRTAGVSRAVALTGGAITSAGLVMAAAFFLFLGNPVPLVQQLGAVVVAGLLLDTLVVRSFLVPALVRLLGRRSGITATNRESATWAPDR
jgi:putative drug exporter of the RND superfamily